MQTLIFALVQGITELFPISSVGHGVLLPYLFHWPNIQSSPAFLPFIVMLHVGTAVALLIFFFQDWLVFLRALFASGSEGKQRSTRSARKEFLLLIVATLPAVIIGGLGAKKFAVLFATPRVAMVFLFVNGLILIYADRLLRRKGTKTASQLTFGQAIVIGILQSFALIPGFSRSAMTMVGGLLYGLRYEAAARFSFLLATPIILGAAVKELPKLHHAAHGMLQMALIGGVVAGIAAYLSTWFLMRYFKTHEVKALRPFGIYCIIVGLGTLLYSFIA
ncbi:undecaprenyl-diphosphate phosphatase [Sulfoacidibacillus thermotolerans]|nr:undecaprenyl-diphosphate phosphatase [Sulfoacidibacillus thermotolerans]